MKECPWCEGDGWVPENSVLPASRDSFMKALELLKRVAAYGNENKSLSPYALKAVLNQTIGELEEVECGIKKSG